MDQRDAIYRAGVDSLRRCCCPRGLQASGQPLGHHQIWARDSMIALLGARFAADNEIRDALQASLVLLRDHRAPGGAIPNNVDSVTLRPNFRAYADGGLWWVIGSALLAPDRDVVREVLSWYAYQDVDQSGLLSMQESSDWQDLFCTRGKGLYLNCLYVLALRSAAELFDAAEAGELCRRAASVADCINSYFWYAGDKNMLRHIALTFSTEGSPLKDSLGRPRSIPEKRYLTGERYYLPYLGFRDVGEWFDSLGNLLAILAGVADRQQTEIILDFIARSSLDVWPVRSLTPAVQPGDPDWRDYYGELNAPHCYHNGGVWPFLGGFYIAALVKAGQTGVAAQALGRLAQLNQNGQFNEWHHGETGAPMGTRDQAWSAGMYLFACECLERGEAALF
ncbi:MAG: glycoside hydrolase 100 family protein [Candidatus Sulfopaludibacter sp.]|nr:glycoside hydrolase 100 family protein [Candidatus Sulfopaludibacter sp.]